MSCNAACNTPGYLRVRALATPAVLLASVANGGFRGLQDTATPLKVVLATNFINFVLDPILIFGVSAGGQPLVPALGATGAAAATAAAEWAACAALLVQLRQKPQLASGVGLVDSMPRWEEAAPLLRGEALPCLGREAERER